MPIPSLSKKKPENLGGNLRCFLGLACNAEGPLIPEMNLHGRYKRVSGLLGIFVQILFGFPPDDHIAICPKPDD